MIPTDQRGKDFTCIFSHEHLDHVNYDPDCGNQKRSRYELRGSRRVGEINSTEAQHHPGKRPQHQSNEPADDLVANWFGKVVVIIKMRFELEEHDERRKQQRLMVLRQKNKDIFARDDCFV